MTCAEKKGLRVLAADDSAVMRLALEAVFRGRAEQDGLPAMELCGVARDGQECLELMLRLKPDALVLDLEMPRLDGLGVLGEMRRMGLEVPVVLCSAYTERGAKTTLEALAQGADDYVMKPWASTGAEAAVESLRAELLPKVAALVRGTGRPQARTDAVRSGESGRVEVVVIGISTGGPPALERMLPRLAREFPVPVLVVQHMPKLFTGALAARLNRMCRMPVREAFAGAALEAGTIWLAPGDAHMEVSRGERTRGRAEVLLHNRPGLNACRPSADFLFRSAAELYGSSVLALVMTGMGSDGLDGARSVVQAGGTVLAQDEASSVVWGMPGRVVDAGLAQATVGLDQMAGVLQKRAQAGRMQAGRAAGVPVRPPVACMACEVSG